MADEKTMHWTDGSLTPVGLATAPVAEIVANKDNFFRAITEGNERAVKAFIGSDPNCVNWTTEKQEIPYKSYNGGTGLMGAAIWNHPEIADMLLKAGADINAQDKEGNTPLLRAFEQRSVQAAKLLVNNDARPNIPNNDGVSVMDLLANGEVSKMIRDKWAGQTTEVSGQQGKVSLSNVSYGGDLKISDVTEGAELKNVSVKGDLIIGGGQKPPRR